MDPPGIEPGASRMRSERDTITLRTQCREGRLFFTDKLSQSVSQSGAAAREALLLVGRVVSALAVLPTVRDELAPRAQLHAAPACPTEPTAVHSPQSRALCSHLVILFATATQQVIHLENVVFESLADGALLVMAALFSFEYWEPIEQVLALGHH